MLLTLIPTLQCSTQTEKDLISALSMSPEVKDGTMDGDAAFPDIQVDTMWWKKVDGDNFNDDL